MKILYAIQKTGNGHLARAQELIPYLKEYAEVDILLSGSQSQLHIDEEVAFDFRGISLFYGENGNVSMVKTLFKNNFLGFIKDVLRLKLSKYDLIINDYEPVTAWSAKLFGGRIVSLSHQAAMFFDETPKPKRINRVSWFIFKNYAPVTKKYGLHFQKYAENIWTPIIRKKIKELKTNENGAYMVYLPSFSDVKIINVLKNTAAKWIIFSKNTDYSFQTKNCIVHPIDETVFLKSLASCKGVLCNAGFELPSEVMYLKKKLFVIPIVNQIEQEFNAFALKKLGIATHKKLSLNAIKNWIASHKKIDISITDKPENILEKIIEENYFFEHDTLFI